MQPLQQQRRPRLYCIIVKNCYSLPHYMDQFAAAYLANFFMLRPSIFMQALSDDKLFHFSWRGTKMKSFEFFTCFLPVCRHL